MPVKRPARIVAISLALFAVVNGLSYVLRSDGFGLPVVHEGIVRCGFPLVFWKKGGWTNLHDFYLLPFLTDALVAFVAGIVGATLVRKR